MGMLKAIIDFIFPPSNPKTVTLSDFYDHALSLPQFPYSVFSYQIDIVHKTLWEVKYAGNRALTKILATCLHDIMIETLSDQNLFYDFSDPLLIPLPLSKERLKERGWSQTEMLAKALQKIDNHKNFSLNTKILYKIKHTQPQTKLNRAERLENLKNCFFVKKNVQNKNIILLDDTTTTGSTINEARKTLLASGAKRVIAFTVAQA